MKLELSQILKSLVQWLRGGDTEALKTTQQLITLPMIGTVSHLQRP